MSARQTIGGGVFLVACVGVGLPISVGWWTPAALRVADLIQVDVRSSSTVEVGEVKTAFSVAQTTSGRVLWRLTGARIEQPQGDLYHHRVQEPRLLFRQPKAPTVTIRARRATVELPRDRKAGGGGSDYLIVQLEGDVVLVRGETRCETEALTVRVHRKEEQRAQPGGVRIVAPGAVRLVGRPPPSRKRPPAASVGGPWTFAAAGLEAEGSPWQVELKSPISITAAALPASGLLEGERLELGVAGGATVSQIGSASAGKAGLPETLQLVARDVTFKGEGPTQGSAERVVVRWGRVPASAQGALGGLAGLRPAWTYGVQQVEAEAFTGRVARRARAKASQKRAIKPLDLTLSGSYGRLARFPQRAVLQGAPARFEDHLSGQHLAGAELVLNESSDGTHTIEARQGVRFGVVQPAKRKAAGPPVRWQGSAAWARARIGPPAGVASLSTRVAALLRLRSFEARGASGAPITLTSSAGSDLTAERIDYTARAGRRGSVRITRGRGKLGGIERGRRARPWRFAARTATAELDLAALARVTSRVRAAPREPLAALAVVRSADLAGGVVLERIPRADRPERARGVRGERVVLADRRLRVTGQGAALQIGRSQLAAPIIEYALASGRVEAKPTVRWTTTFPRPKARPGKPPPRTPPPLTLRGARAVGRLTAEPALWKADQAARRIERRAGGGGWRLPAALTELVVEGRPLVATGPRGLRISAGRLSFAKGRIGLTGDRGRQVALRSLTGSLAADRIELRREASAGTLLPGRTWVEARGHVRGGVTRKRSPLQLAAGWILAEVRDPGPTAPRGKRPAPTLGLFSAGGPGGVDLRVIPAPQPGKKPARRLALQTARLSGDGSGRLPDGRPGLLLIVPERWTTTVTLPKKGPARVVAGRARAWIDLEAARAGKRPAEAEEAYLRRLLASLEASGGVEVAGSGLNARGDRVELDGAQGAYILRGDPVVVRRAGVEQRVPEWILRLSDE